LSRRRRAHNGYHYRSTALELPGGAFCRGGCCMLPAIPLTPSKIPAYSRTSALLQNGSSGLFSRTFRSPKLESSVLASLPPARQTPETGVTPIVIFNLSPACRWHLFSCVGRRPASRPAR
jgi:hypothetical protein